MSINHSKVALFAAVSAFALPALVAQKAPFQGGTVSAIQGKQVTLKTDANASIVIDVDDDTKIMQLAPGSKDLKTATSGGFESVALGDRALVTGKVGDAASELHAARIILMKSDAIAAQKASQQADWQRNGTGGLVRGVEGQQLTVAAGAKTIKVATTPNTIFRRYALDSIAFSDAKPGQLDQIRTGDQISVRGPKSDDGAIITADEVVTGTFENLSGAIASVDVNAQTITLKDLATKKTEVIHVTPNSDLRKLPPQAAAAFAHRNDPAASAPAAAPAAAAAGQNRRAGMDLSRMLARLPQVTLADLKAGDAVMIVASSGRGDSLTAITMLSGVEQLLSAPGSAPITLSPWQLGGLDGGGGAGSQ